MQMLPLRCIIAKFALGAFDLKKMMTPTQLFRLAGALFILAGIASLIAHNYVFVAMWMALGAAFLAISGSVKSSK
jgi:hypothetical protein